MESLSAFSSMSDLPSFSRDDIRYAAEMTRVVYEPDRRIDTFGDTRFNFLLLSELMDEVNVVRVRSGWVEAEKPKIIRPSIYNEISTEGFSGEAKRFFDWLSKNGPGFLTLLEYGFRFKRSEVSEEILHEPLDSVRGRLLDQVRNGEDTFMALIEGVDDAWAVCQKLWNCCSLWRNREAWWGKRRRNSSEGCASASCWIPTDRT